MDYQVNELLGILWSEYEFTDGYNNVINSDRIERNGIELNQYVSNLHNSNSRNRNSIGLENTFNAIDNYAMSQPLRMMLLNLLSSNNRGMYRVLINMSDGQDGNELEDVPTPLNDEQISKIKCHKYDSTFKKSNNIEDDQYCAICQEKVNEMDEIAQLPCEGKHYYHSPCIMEWLSKLSKKCPICRENIETKLS